VGGSWRLLQAADAPAPGDHAGQPAASRPLAAHRNVVHRLLALGGGGEGVRGNGMVFKGGKPVGLGETGSVKICRNSFVSERKK